jgi:urea carboxylase
MFQTVLVANRGVIACRILRTLRTMGIRSVAVYSEADVGAPHVNEADVALCIGPPSPALSYLDADKVLTAARSSGADAIHPGYGFLSENAEFAERCAQEGRVFIGPRAAQIRDFGRKHTARALATSHGVPLVPGSGLLADSAAARAAAALLGYPVMLKATAGGGGIGMSICRDDAELELAYARVSRLAASNFADAGVFLERYVPQARHIEVQIIGDGQGRVLALGERDCSLQRRHQKVLEETPAPGLPEAMRSALQACAVRLGQAVDYQSAGTVEFLYDAQREAFHFLEVNTRLQVEHGVTEQVTGVDLVEWMVRIAAGDLSGFDRPPPVARGASIQVRLYAEDPARDFLPSSGQLTRVSFPAGVRVESWVRAGSEVSAYYDPLLAKLIVTAADRPTAVARLREALDATRLDGLDTNLEWLRAIAAEPFFAAGQVSTQSLETVHWQARGVRVLAGGLSTSVQDYPGRLGYWHVGVPPSGPMDSLAFRRGNGLLGNLDSAAGLEITAVGPRLQFLEPTRICLTGADLGAEIDGIPLAPYCVCPVAAGQILSTGRVRGAGLRAYLLVAGGFDVPTYLGSRSTFTLGALGGHGGRTLVAGDTLRLGTDHGTQDPLQSNGQPGAETGGAWAHDPGLTPELTHDWVLGVCYGPHGAPEFFTDQDIATLEAAHWTVHHDSSRTGVRLVGPSPQWARRDGGEAGLHPSNIHDNPYAVGAVDFTGDMPILLGPDGPSLGGFVCPFVVCDAELWKLGQLAPGDRLRLRCIDPPGQRRSWLARRPADDGRPEVVYRRQGDSNLLVEYGPLVLDLELRLRIHALMLAVAALDLPGVVDVTPGIRSLQVHFDPARLPDGQLLAELEALEEGLGTLDDFEIPSRVVHLPLSWEDPAVAETIRRYEGSVRDDAPWCPNNVEFIRRVNGLASAAEVERTVFAANYLVLGLGDVYLGAPVAVPLDPRHRLVTTKYNPARTWTPPNVVGIGGAYLCIYGMEGPGGYQLFGRTLQVWNTWCRGVDFADGQPWLLRFFDQLRFFPVSHDELMAWRADFEHGRRPLRIEHTRFRLSDYRRLLSAQAGEIAAFQHCREAAFAAERAEWERQGEFARAAALAAQVSAPQAAPLAVIGQNQLRLESPLGGLLWQWRVAVGDRVAAGAPLLVIEAMKMQCEIPSPAAGTIRALHVLAGGALSAGQPLLDLDLDTPEMPTAEKFPVAQP